MPFILYKVELRGLKQWRTELTGKVKFEVASNVVSLAIRFREEIIAMRMPITYPSESSDREQDEDEESYESTIRDEYYARLKRLERSRDAMLELREASWQAEVFFGDEVAELIKPLAQAYTKMQSSIHMHFHARLEQAGRPALIKPSEAYGKLEQDTVNIVYGIDDEFSESVRNSVENLANRLKKFVR